MNTIQIKLEYYFIWSLRSLFYAHFFISIFSTICFKNHVCLAKRTYKGYAKWKSLEMDTRWVSHLLSLYLPISAPPPIQHRIAASSSILVHLSSLHAIYTLLCSSSIDDAAYFAYFDHFGCTWHRNDLTVYATLYVNKLHFVIICLVIGLFCVLFALNPESFLVIRLFLWFLCTLLEHKPGFLVLILLRSTNQSKSKVNAEKRQKRNKRKNK